MCDETSPLSFSEGGSLISVTQTHSSSTTISPINFSVATVNSFSFDETARNAILSHHALRRIEQCKLPIAPREFDGYAPRLRMLDFIKRPHTSPLHQHTACPLQPAPPYPQAHLQHVSSTARYPWILRPTAAASASAQPRAMSIPARCDPHRLIPLLIQPTIP